MAEPTGAKRKPGVILAADVEGYTRLMGTDTASTHTQLLAPLLDSKGKLEAEYRKRRDRSVYTKVHPADERDYLAKGWEVHRHLKRSVRMKRQKPHDAALEDRVWCLFYRMGYPNLSGPNFLIKFSRQRGSLDEKQLDVFAKDDETVLVIECKSRKTRSRRSLQKDLHETASLQKPIADAVRKFYGSDFKPKFIWLYVTNNVIWSEPDYERAAAVNVRIITENELQYYEAFISHIGPAGRFQFLAEFLKGQKIPALSNRRVPAIRGKLAGHTFYNFVTTPRHLLKIAFVNHYALDNPDGRPAYQRMLSRTRIKQISKFIQSGGYFPTNILINFLKKSQFDLLPKQDNLDEAIKFGWLYLPNRYRSAWVIDGQHRLYGFSPLDEKFLDQDIVVIAFEELDTKTEADLFVTINHKQKTVPRNLLVALQADLYLGSDEPKERLNALCAQLIRVMNADPTSPLFRRFVVEGVPPAENQSLTIPEAVKGLVRANLIGRVLHGQFVPGPLAGPTDDDTVKRARRLLNGYFDMIRDAHPARWETGRGAHIAVNPGVRGFLMLLAELLRYLSAKRSLDPHVMNEVEILSEVALPLKPVLRYLTKASASDIETLFARKFGEGGVIEYYYALCDITHNELADFGSEEYKTYKERKSDVRVHKANQDIIDLNTTIADYVFDVLKMVYGTEEQPSGERAYWELGIESAAAKEQAYKRHLLDPINKRLLKDAYVDVLDLMKIVRQKNNWSHFESVFNIPMPEEKGKAYYLKWLERFNELRRIPSHASPLRMYSEEDFEFLDWLKNEFYSRLERARLENGNKN